MHSRSWPYAGRVAFALALLAMMLLVKEGHHLDNPVDIAGYDVQNGQLVAEHGGPPPSGLLNVGHVVNRFACGAEAAVSHRL